MKKLLLLALALVAMAFSGCVQEAPEEEPNATELKAVMLDSVRNIDTYSFRLESVQNIVITNRSEDNASSTHVTITSSGQGSVNLTGKAMSVISTMNAVSDSTTNATPIQTETYFINDSIYSRVDQNWTLLQVPQADMLWEQQNMVAQQAELLNASSIEYEGSETVNGQDCHKIRVIPEMDAYAAILSQQMGSSLPLAYLNLTELYRSGTMEWISWVTKDTHVLTRNEIVMTLTITPDILGLSDEAGDFEMDVDVRAVMDFMGFNQPVHIVLPEEASSAEPLVLTQGIQAVPVSLNE